MKIQNKQDRSSAIWRFVAVSAFVGLLILLGGFSAGRTFKKFNEDYFDRYYEEVEKVAALEKKMADENLLFGQADSVVQVFISEIERLDASLKNAEIDAATSIKILLDVSDDAFLAKRDFDRQFKLLAKDAAAADPGTKMGLNYIEQYANQHFYRLDAKQKGLIDMIKQGQENILDERLRELNAQQTKLEDATAAMGEEADKAALQTKLTQCQAQLETLKTIGSKSYAAEAVIIRAKVDAIKSEVIPKMKGKFIGKNTSRLDELKDILDGHVDAIMSAANKIE